MFKKSFLGVFLIAVFILGIAPAYAVDQDGNYTYEDFMGDSIVADDAPADGRAAHLPKKSGLVKVSGQYRLAFGVDDDGILNDANADFQDRNFRYLFGEDLNNTFDQAIYSRYLLNVEFTPKNNISFFTQIVADPWSYVGTTGDQIAKSPFGDNIFFRYNLKYFGAFNSTINEVYRANITDSIAVPIIKINDGRLTPQTVHGFFDYSPFTGGVPYNIEDHEIDYEFHPIRKLWVDLDQGEHWHMRVFALADQSMALTTDDPIGLSNHKAYWQQSPWLNSYEPIMHFTDGSIRRGYYSDAVSFLAKDSEGNYLTLLKGIALEANLQEDNYFAGTIAAPHSPWDEDYLRPDNWMGAFRFKHHINPDWMIGATYTARTAMIDQSAADHGQSLGFDTKFYLNQNTTITGEVAGTHRDRDLLSDERLLTEDEGYAYHLALESDFDHDHEGHTWWRLSFNQMDQYFDPLLSRYTNTRDDYFWGKHLTFKEYSPELEYFRLGDGVDVNRFVFRFQWKESMWKDKFFNLFDARNVHKTHNTAYLETVIREEMTYKINDKWSAKGLFRWQGLPHTTEDNEPFLSNYYFYNDSGLVKDELKNFDIPPDKDPSRFTYGAALQYIHNPRWTFEGFWEISNDISDFPRGLMNNNFRNANDIVDGLLLDHLTNFLYSQGHLGAIPPYEYHNTFRERIIWKKDDRTTITFHAAQNGWKYATGIDDNINHQGVSYTYKLNTNTTFFADYTHSMQIDVPRLISSGFVDHDYRNHHNVYASVNHNLNASTVLRAEYGVFGLGDNTPFTNPYSVTTFNLPTIDTEHLLRVSLNGDF